MRIAVSATGDDLEAPFSPLFGRCSFFILVDTDSMAFQAVPNGGVAAAGGAGIQAAQEVADRGAEAVITGHLGPNAYKALAAAGLAGYLFGSGTVRQAVEAYKAGGLSQASAATGPAHAGMGVGGGMGVGMGRGGRGMGPGMGRGGRGMGPGMGRGGRGVGPRR